MAIEGLESVLRALREQNRKIIDAAKLGLKKAALHLVARAKALSPIDTGNLSNSIAFDGRIEETTSMLRAQVTATATGGAEAEHNYSAKVHENMVYEGPNVGGAHTQNRGARTLAKGTSKVEPSDGSAGGKYLERPLRNKPEQYTKIVLAAVQKVLKGTMKVTATEGGDDGVA
jgi:hypothetical protein